MKFPDIPKQREELVSHLSEASSERNYASCEDIAQREITEAIAKLESVTEDVLKENLCASYLSGSIVTGDFDLDSSDIDLFVVTNESISAKTIEDLKREYKRIRGEGGWWDGRTEGVFLTKEFCESPSSVASCQYVLKTNGDFVLSQNRSDWIVQLYIAREYGTRLQGQDIQEFTPTITPAQLQDSSIEAMPFIMEPEEDQQTERLTALHVLSACRQLYTKTTGKVGTKSEAAEWTKQLFPSKEKIIDEALLKRGSFDYSDCRESYSFIKEVQEVLKYRE